MNYLLFQKTGKILLPKEKISKKLHEHPWHRKNDKEGWLYVVVLLSTFIY
jgi:hypothetical protein